MDKKRILIVEESLRDIEAHWFEYIKTISKGLKRLGWEVNVACNKNANSQILNSFSAFGIFKHSRYLDFRKKKLPGERYYGFLVHNLRCLKVIWRFFNKQERYDKVFVPTVLVHHLLAWYLIMKFHRKSPKNLTLFFVTPPSVWNEKSKKPELPKSSNILKLLLKLFRSLANLRIVSFAVNAKNAKSELESLSGLTFKLLPHPVSFDVIPSQGVNESRIKEENKILFASLGFARHEKGSDLLKKAIESILIKFPDFAGHFILQWDKGFKMLDGSICQLGDILSNHPKVTVITKPMSSLEYREILLKTDCVILPYRNSSYYARASQAVTEAAFNGKPIIYTKGGWLEENANSYSAGIGITDESVEELTKAILAIAENYDLYLKSAIQQMPKARAYLDPQHFCRLLIEGRLTVA